jgi:hypothetical protein
VAASRSLRDIVGVSRPDRSWELGPGRTCCAGPGRGDALPLPAGPARAAPRPSAAGSGGGDGGWGGSVPGPGALGWGWGGVRGGRWREGCRGTSDWTPVRRCRFPFRNLKREKPAFLSSRASTLRRRLCKPDKRGNGDPRGSQSFGVNREEIRQLYPGGSGSRSGLLERSLESVPAWASGTPTTRGRRLVSEDAGWLTCCLDLPASRACPRASLNIIIIIIIISCVDPHFWSQGTISIQYCYFLIDSNLPLYLFPRTVLCFGHFKGLAGRAALPFVCVLPRSSAGCYLSGGNVDCVSRVGWHGETGVKWCNWPSASIQDSVGSVVCGGFLRRNNGDKWKK